MLIAVYAWQQDKVPSEPALTLELPSQTITKTKSAWRNPSAAKKK